jgi:biotin carboxyl carrier protein
LAKHRYRIEGQNFDVDVHALSATHAEVTVNGQRIRVEREAPASAEPAAVAPAAKTPRRVVRAAAGELRAPMAGLVLRIDVREGQTLRAGDPVLVLDAMKMENSLRWPHDGVVQEVAVQEGQSVLTGALLARIG